MITPSIRPHPAMLALTITALSLVTPTFASIPGTPDDGDTFGYSLAHGDFNGDGLDDLAIGVPGEWLGDVMDAGMVQVIYGSTFGLTPYDSQEWTQDSPGIAGLAENGDNFGQVAAAGDFDGDGFDDLAIGVPREGIGDEEFAGAVQIIYGSAAGLTDVGDQLWHQDSPGITGAAESTDFFGFSLSSGDFDGNGFDDLAVGAPFENLSVGGDAGYVNVIYGSATGLSSSGSQGWSQVGLHGFAAGGEQFGFSLACGDFNDDGWDDLAVGVPTESVSGVSSAGGVNIVYGSAAGLTATGNQHWDQDSSGLPGAAEPGDGFGRSVASGDFDGDGITDLAIGVPFEGLTGALSAGVVHTLYGTIGGLSAERNQLWSQNSAGLGEVAEDDDQFGSALTTGDFDGDGIDDLAVGAPREGLGSIEAGGLVSVLAGSDDGLTTDGSRGWKQGFDGVLDTFEDLDKFGSVLAAGNFDGVGGDELAVGVRDEDIDGVIFAGAVNVLADPLSAYDSAGQFLYQGADIVVSVGDSSPSAGAPMPMMSASPNPFHPRTTIGYDVPEAGPVRLTVFDARGRRVARLLDESLAAGRHTVNFDGNAFPSGVYFVRMEAGGVSVSRRVTLAK